VARVGGDPALSSDTQPADSRVPELDVARGIAIACVLCIHSRLFFPSIAYTHLVERAVPMLLVLFGLSSSLWWDQPSARRSTADWYRSRLVRLVPAYWLAVLLWWLGSRWLDGSWRPVDTMALCLAGYAPWIQTSWFVTAILQLVLLYPLLRWLVQRAGLIGSIAISGVCMVLCQAYAFELTELLRSALPYPEAAPGFYPFWIFVPPYLWLVTCGMAMAPFVRTRAPAGALTGTLFGAIAVFLAAGMIEGLTPRPSLLIRVAMAIADVARTVLLLLASHLLVLWVPRMRIARLSDVLAWCGRNSWELYLGQMVAHSLGYSIWTRMGGPTEHRLVYTAVLALAGILLAGITRTLGLHLRAAPR